MNLRRAKKVLCVSVIVATCVGCASLKPVKEQSVIADADVPSGITTSPGSGIDGTRAPNPGVVTPSVITQPPNATQDSYRTLSSLLLARDDLPNAWEEDASGTGESDTTEGWLGLGSCLRTPVPALEISGSSFSIETNLLASITTTSSLFSSPTDAQSSLVALDDLRPGGVSNKCFKDFIEETVSDGGMRAVVAELSVVEDAVPGLSNRIISVVVDITEGFDTVSFYIQMTVAVKGPATVMLVVSSEYGAQTNYDTDLNNAYAAVFGRLVSVYGTEPG